MRMDTPIPTDIRIRTMGADIHTGPTDIIHIGLTDIMGPLFTGTAVIEPTTRGRTIDAIITETGTNLKLPRFSRPAGEKSRRLYFFGDVDAAGPDIDAPDGDGS